MAETRKVVAILIGLISSSVSCIQLNIAMLNSHADYVKKWMNIIRLLSNPATKTVIVKWLDKWVEDKNEDFGFDLVEQLLGAWNGSVSKVVPEEWRLLNILPIITSYWTVSNFGRNTRTPNYSVSSLCFIGTEQGKIA